MNIHFFVFLSENISTLQLTRIRQTIINSSSMTSLSKQEGGSFATEDTSPSSSFRVYVSKDTFKFNAAHFVAFDGYRERLHGHNYQVGVTLLGNHTIGQDGYVIDFGCIKQATKLVCKRLNEHFICPVYSNVLEISETTTTGSSNNAPDMEQVQIKCQDGSLFSFPKQDCAMLPLVHATTEELAIYLYAEILSELQADYLVKRNMHTMEITVAEAPGQEATFRHRIPTDGNYKLDVREFITKGKLVPLPCLPRKDPSEKATSSASCKDCALCRASKKRKLDLLSEIVQTANSAKENGVHVTVGYLQDVLQLNHSTTENE